MKRTFKPTHKQLWFERAERIMITALNTIKVLEHLDYVAATAYKLVFEMTPELFSNRTPKSTSLIKEIKAFGELYSTLQIDYRDAN